MPPSPFCQFNVHLFMIRCQLRNKKIFLDVFSFDKSKQRRMLCQPDDLLHYPYNVSLRYLMQAVAAMF
jgi:hypothetical protein